MIEALLLLFRAAGLPFGLLATARLLARRLDDRSLFRSRLVASMPVLAAAALEFASLRASTLASAFAPLAVWSPDSPWRVGWNELVARHLAPEVVLGGLLALAPGRDRQVDAALALAGVCLAVTAVRAALAWRSRAAWRGLLLFGAKTLAWVAVLHAALVLTFWTVHWLNFWLFFVLLLFVELRRGEGSKYQAS